MSNTIDLITAFYNSIGVEDRELFSTDEEAVEQIIRFARNSLDIARTAPNLSEHLALSFLFKDILEAWEKVKDLNVEKFYRDSYGQVTLEVSPEIIVDLLNYMDKFKIEEE